MKKRLKAVQGVPVIDLAKPFIVTDSRAQNPVAFKVWSTDACIDVYQDSVPVYTMDSYTPTHILGKQHRTITITAEEVT